MSQRGFYIPSLDGIRAFSVLLVFFAHTSFGHIIPGGMGVTIFFFLSGYLITTLMRMEYEKTQDLSFKKFYLRRIYRIFPPLYIVILVTFLLSVAGILDAKFSAWGLASHILQFTNYYIIFLGEEGLLSGLGVLWSLAVEEHFYLVFPFIFLFLSQRFSLFKSALILLLICFAVLIWRYIILMVWGLPDNYETRISYNYAYYATDTRMDLLLYGCIMALACNPVYHQRQEDAANPSHWWNKNWVFWCSLVFGIGTLLFTLLYREPHFRESLRYTLQGIALFPLFYFAISRPNWLLFRLLNWQPIMYLGKLSYTFYLSHYVVIDVVLKYVGDGMLVLNVVSFIVTFIFCALMYHFVETRFAELRKRLHK